MIVIEGRDIMILEKGDERVGRETAWLKFPEGENG
jgi:hypothetical protein